MVSTSRNDIRWSDRWQRCVPRISHRSSEISLCLWHRRRWSPTIYNRRQEWHRLSWRKWTRQSIESTELPDLSSSMKNKHCMCLSGIIIVWWNGIKVRIKVLLWLAEEGREVFSHSCIILGDSPSIHQVQSMSQKHGMIVWSVLSPMKHHETNGFFVVESVCSCEGMVVRFSSLSPWLSLFSGHLSRRVIASLFWHYQVLFEVKWKHLDNDYKFCVTSFSYTLFLVWNFKIIYIFRILDHSRSLSLRFSYSRRKVQWHHRNLFERWSIHRNEKRLMLRHKNGKQSVWRWGWR